MFVKAVPAKIGKCPICNSEEWHHDEGCYREQLMGLVHAVNALLGDASEGAKMYVRRVVDDIRAKNDNQSTKEEVKP